MRRCWMECLACKHDGFRMLETDESREEVSGYRCCRRTNAGRIRTLVDRCVERTLWSNATSNKWER